MNQVEITEHSTDYNISYKYFSEAMGVEKTARICATQYNDGKISIEPDRSDEFVFISSDPDLVIAIANMMKAFAEMAKNEDKYVSNEEVQNG